MVGAGTDHSKQPGQGGPAIVLVRPQLAVNIGMAARAMANFGLSDLRLVAPKGGWPRTDKYREDAEAAAAGAVHLLDRAQVFARLEDGRGGPYRGVRHDGARTRPGQARAPARPRHGRMGGAASRPARSAGSCSGRSGPGSTTTRSRSPMRS